MNPAPDLQKARAKGKRKKEKMIDFETYHSQKEEIRRLTGKVDGHPSDNTEMEKLIERAKEQKRRDVDYISWLLEKDAEKKRAVNNL